MEASIDILRIFWILELFQSSIELRQLDLRYSSGTHDAPRSAVKNLQHRAFQSSIDRDAIAGIDRWSPVPVNEVASGLFKYR